MRTPNDVLEELAERSTSPHSFQRGYVKESGEWREESDDELRARIKAGNRATPGLESKR